VEDGEQENEEGADESSDPAYEEGAEETEKELLQVELLSSIEENE
jgi:hypothetical protein